MLEHLSRDRLIDLRHPMDVTPAPHLLQPTPDGGGGEDGLQVDGFSEDLIISDLPDILDALTLAVDRRAVSHTGWPPGLGRSVARVGADRGESRSPWPA